MVPWGRKLEKSKTSKRDRETEREVEREIEAQRKELLLNCAMRLRKDRKGGYLARPLQG